MPATPTALQPGKVQFSGHETFPLRYGWLKKVADVLLQEPAAAPRVFETDFAMSAFGVGKNMVVAMRYWSLATWMIDPDSATPRLSRIGRALLAGDGLDPYLEDPASLWLLHWEIASQPDRTTTWYWAFNHLNSVELDRDALIADLMALSKSNGLRRASTATIRRDVDCFLRTYVVGRARNGALSEESLECPLAELELISASSTRGLYRFNRGPKPSLPDGVFNYALARFWEFGLGEAESASLDTVTYAPGSPGRVFKLDEASVAERLSRIEETSEGVFGWSETAGLQQVHRDDPEIDPLFFLEAAYPPDEVLG